MAEPPTHTGDVPAGAAPAGTETGTPAESGTGESVLPGPAPREPSTPADPVRLVASARFVAETVAVPPGISGRDLQGFAEGKIDELSLLPAEATAWGYLGGGRGAAPGSILLYAASREQIEEAGAAEPARYYAVLPGFASLPGRKWRKTTWVSLLEAECVTLVRFPERSCVPDYVRGRYGTRLDRNPQAAWTLRRELLEAAPRVADDRVEEGLVRCGTPYVDGRGYVCFPLEHRLRPGSAWKRCGPGRLGPESALFAADVRARQFLGEERNRRRALRQLRAFLRAAALVVLLLGALQYRHHRRNREAVALTAQVVVQRSAVKALQEREAITRSAARLAAPPLEPFEWLTAVNGRRPDTVAFHTAYFGRDRSMGFTGEAPSVSVVNQYREALEKTGRYAGIDIREVKSAKQGVTFSMQLRLAEAPAKAPAGGESS